MQSSTICEGHDGKLDTEPYHFRAGGSDHDRIAKMPTPVMGAGCHVVRLLHKLGYWRRRDVEVHSVGVRRDADVQDLNFCGRINGPRGQRELASGSTRKRGIVLRNRPIHPHRLRAP